MGGMQGFFHGTAMTRHPEADREQQQTEITTILKIGHVVTVEPGLLLSWNGLSASGR